MSRFLQGLWYRRSAWHLILLPLAAIFWLLSALRRWLYRRGWFASYALPVPVIVVGNITVGGTGKTPLVIWLARQLALQGHKPAIISRGYGKQAGDHTASRLARIDSSADEVGDEPLLIARRTGLPVWVGRDRVAAGKAALQAQPDCTVIISDDGLQHSRLQRDVEIAVVDGRRGLGNGWLLPAGPLREGPWRLKEVDAVVVNRAPGRQEYPSFPGVAPLFNMALQGQVFQQVGIPQTQARPADWQGRPVHAVAGIGHPQRFFDQLQQMGLEVIPHAFPDHHPFQPEDLAFGDDAPIVMTEKDAVKCAAFAGSNCWQLPVEAEIDSALLATILNKIGTGNGR